MQLNDLDQSTLRRLAQTRPGAPVLSLFLSLDPREFATPPARASAITSLCDEAERRARAAEGLTHDQKAGLLAGVKRARAFLAEGDVMRGAHGVAVYCCPANDMFEALRLPRPVEAAAVVDDSPYVQPLADVVDVPDVCVLLVNRRTTRLLCGSSEGLREIGSFQDDVHGQHDQGGWSQARYQRSIDAEVDDHLKRTAEAIFRHLRAHPFRALLIGTPDELHGQLEARLHADVTRLLRGRVEVDVEHTSADQVHQAALPAIERLRSERERDALDRLAEGVGAGGRAATGLGEVLAALCERRVDTLLYEDGLRRPGRACDGCGWLDVDLENCPVDGARMQRRENVIEDAVERAIAQSAQVLVVRHHPDLGPLQGIAAILRF